MKILYLIDSLEGYGAEKSIVQIALNLKGITPVFIHLYNGDKLKSLLLKNGIKVYSLNLNEKYGFKKAVKLITPIIREEKPVIIHSTLFRADMVGRKLKSLFPDIILIGSFVSNSYGKKRYKLLSLISKIKLFSIQLKDLLTGRSVDYFISNSYSIKKTNIHALNINNEKVKVIYRGRCFKDFKPSLDTELLLKQEFNLQDQKIFLNVSRLHRGKGQEDLLKAFSILLKEFPDVVLIIAGEGSFRRYLEKQIKKLKLEKNVFLLGYREDVAELLAFADFFVFPSYFEGLPGALIEAIISGTPSIVSDIDENRECFHDGGALFFETGNINDLSKQMKQALITEDWGDRTKTALLYARQNFDIEKVSDQYEQYYKEINGKFNNH